MSTIVYSPVAANLTRIGELLVDAPSEWSERLADYLTAGQRAHVARGARRVLRSRFQVITGGGEGGTPSARPQLVAAVAKGA